MPLVPLVLAGLATLTSVLGSALLVLGDTPYAPSAGALAALGVLILTVIGSAGLVIAAGRWSVPLLALGALAWLAVAAVSSVTALSMSVVTAASASLVSLLGPWSRRWVRHTPSLDGPSPETAVLLLALAGTPALAGLASPVGAGASVWVWSGWALVLAAASSRAVPGSILGLRFGHPVLSLAAAVAAGFPAGLALPATAVLPTALAWRRDVRIEVTSQALHREEPVPFPPELVPEDVMTAAGLDDRGRPAPEGGRQ